MDAVGVERREGEFRGILGAQVDHRLPVAVADYQVAAGAGDRQRDHQRGDHPGCLLAVAVGAEEPSRLVDQQLVEARLGALARAAEPCGGATDDLRQRVAPRTAADIHVGRVDLPAIAHRTIQHGVRPPAVWCPFRGRDQGLSLRLGHGKGDQPGSRHLQARQRYEQPSVRAVLSGAVDRAQQSLQLRLTGMVRDFDVRHRTSPWVR